MTPSRQSSNMAAPTSSTWITGGALSPVISHLVMMSFIPKSDFGVKWNPSYVFTFTTVTPTDGSFFSFTEFLGRRTSDVSGPTQGQRNSAVQ